MQELDVELTGTGVTDRPNLFGRSTGPVETSLLNEGVGLPCLILLS